MCPDRQLLSVYIDGELPSPWNEKMECHLAQCPGCRRWLEQYRQCFPPESAAPADMAPVKERVWQKLQSDMAAKDRKPLAAKQAFWGRSLSIPLPAAAVAAVALCIAFVLLWARKPAAVALDPEMALASEELDAPGIVPVSNMGDVLQYLGDRDSGDILILRLPESRNFSSSGEPAIIKAADYSRRKP